MDSVVPRTDVHCPELIHSNGATYTVELRRDPSNSPVPTVRCYRVVLCTTFASVIPMDPYGHPVPGLAVPVIPVILRSQSC